MGLESHHCALRCHSVTHRVATGTLHSAPKTVSRDVTGYRVALAPH
jgi:hypothetical protein